MAGTRRLVSMLLYKAISSASVGERERLRLERGDLSFCCETWPSVVGKMQCRDSTLEFESNSIQAVPFS